MLDHAAYRELLAIRATRPGEVARRWADRKRGPSPTARRRLFLLGCLESKVVIGSMNRGGLQGASFELDDRITGYTAEAITAAGLDGGKLLLRVDMSDPGTLATLEYCARALADQTAAGAGRAAEGGPGGRVAAT